MALSGTGICNHFWYGAPGNYGDSVIKRDCVVIRILAIPPKLFWMCAGGAGGKRRKRLKLDAPIGRLALQGSAKACSTVVATQPHRLQ